MHVVSVCAALIFDRQSMLLTDGENIITIPRQLRWIYTFHYRANPHKLRRALHVLRAIVTMRVRVAVGEETGWVWW